LKLKTCATKDITELASATHGRALAKHLQDHRKDCQDSEKMTYRMRKTLANHTFF
jgi:hypothetical protein